MRRVNLVPLAGAGQRFIDAGYQTPKPLIEINDIPMIVHAAKSLPPADHWIFICRAEHIHEYQLDHVLKEYFPKADIVSVDHLTEGQACTCLLAEKLLRPDDQLTIGACDNAMGYDLAVYEAQIDKADAFIWTFRNNPSVLQNPKMYGWVKVDEAGKATHVSCKIPISETPMQDHAVVGAFTFKRADIFTHSVKSMIEKNRRINNEFYMDVALDECIQLEYKVSVFEIEHYICWGTPLDLLIYKYWDGWFNFNKTYN